MNETSAPPTDPVPPPGEPSQAQPDPPVTRRLERHPTDKVLGGVAGGLGRYFGVDPIVFRLAFVGFALFGGGGILLYLIAWAAMPLGEGREAAPARDGVDFSAWVGLGLVVLALLMLGGALFTLRAGFVAALVLLAGGVLLFTHSSQGRDAAARSGFPSAGPRPHGAVPGDPTAPVAPGDTAPLGPPPPAEPPPPRRPKSRLGRLTLALMFLALGVIGFLDATAVLSPSMGDYAALVLAALGAGLVVGAWWGRARALVPLGVLLVPVVLVASILPEGPGLRGGTGEVYERPASAAALAHEYRLGVGQLTVDLRDVALAPGEIRSLWVTVGAGEVTVVLPDSLTVVARADAGIGTVDLFGMRTSGLQPQLGGERTGSPFSGTLDLVVRAGVGQVRVARVAAAAPLHPFRGNDLFGSGSGVF